MTTPPAGWYAAPDGQPYERWWTGSAWGEQTRAAGAAAPAAPSPVGPSKMVTYQPVKTSHTFHLIMSILTGGLWAIFVWLPIGLINSVSRRKVTTRLR